MHNFSELLMNCVAIAVLLGVSFLFIRIIISKGPPFFSPNNLFIKILLFVFMLDIISRIVFLLSTYDSINLGLRSIVHGSFVALYVLLFVFVFRKRRNSGN